MYYILIIYILYIFFLLLLILDSTIIAHKNQDLLIVVTPIPLHLDQGFDLPKGLVLLGVTHPRNKPTMDSCSKSARQSMF